MAGGGNLNEPKRSAPAVRGCGPSGPMETMMMNHITRDDFESALEKSGVPYGKGKMLLECWEDLAEILPWLPNGTKPKLLVPPTSSFAGAASIRRKTSPGNEDRDEPALTSRKVRARACKRCGEIKGVTAFNAGQDVCRVCAKTNGKSNGPSRKTSNTPAAGVKAAADIALDEEESRSYEMGEDLLEAKRRALHEMTRTGARTCRVSAPSGLVLEIWQYGDVVADVETMEADAL